jgi:hypothetical protein
MQERETRDHLFFNCRFTARVWNFLGITWTSDVDITVMFDRAKQTFQGPKFIEVATCALWAI